MKLIIHLKLLILVFVANVWVCTADSTQNKNLQEAQAKCQEEHGITDETLIALRNREMILEDESDESQKCFIECMLVHLQMIQDGQFDVPTVMSIAKPMLESVEEHGREVNEEGLKSDIKNCTAQSPEGECTGTYEMWKCLQGIMSNIMLQVPQAE